MGEEDYKRVGPIVAERDGDEGLSATVVQGGRKSASRHKAEAESRKAGQQDSVKARSGGRLINAVLVVAMAALGAHAVYLTQQYRDTHAALGDLQTRFNHLEEQILTTDESLSESGATIQAKLREVDSEIRKLWGVSNDRNRKAIAANEEAIRALRGNTESLKQAQGKQAEAISALRSSVEGFDRKISAANAEVLAAKAGVDQIGSRLNEVKTTADRVSAAEKRVNALESRVGTHEEAIQSIDAFRRQTNQSLLQLRQQTGTQ